MGELPGKQSTEDPPSAGSPRAGWPRPVSGPVGCARQRYPGCEISVVEGSCPWRRRGEQRASQAWQGQGGARIVGPSSRHTGGTAPLGRSPVACKTDTSNAQDKEGSMRVTGMGRGSEHETRGSTVLKWQPSSFVVAFSAGIWGSCRFKRDVVQETLPAASRTPFDTRA